MVERWKPVLGYEGLYEVSDQGRVRSLDRLVLHGRGEAMRRRKGQMLRPGRKPSGHMSVSLGKSDSHDVHVLVLSAFIGPKPDGHEGLHRNDIPGDNRLENLRWGTRGDNIADAFSNGGRGNGERATYVKLTEGQARRAKFGKERPCNLAREFGVNESTIRCIRNGRNWGHL